MYIQVQIRKGEFVPLHAMKGDWRYNSTQKWKRMVSLKQ